MPSPPLATKILRADVLAGVVVVLAGDGATGAAEFAPAIAGACEQLGARTTRWRDGEPVPGDVDVLVVDAASTFSTAPARAGGELAGAATALRGCLDHAWQASHAVANAAFIDAPRSGRIVFVAPRCAAVAGADAPRAGGAQAAAQPGVAQTATAHAATAHADAARAGLENLARTLSIEWARFGIATVALAPGQRTTPDELATIVAYLASPAGAYF